MSTEDDTGKAIRILSFDNGGKGTFSQALMVKEYMDRLAYESRVDERDLFPADYFDLMGGAGLGGLVALMLGYLRMNAEYTIEAFRAITSTVFPPDDIHGIFDPETRTKQLKGAIEEMLEARNLPLDLKMNDQRSPSTKCKVAIYAATSANLNHPTIFRTYPARRPGLNPTIVQAICATMVVPSLFSPVKIGRPQMEQTFVGGPVGANNPTRELLKEASNVFGKDRYIAQIISLGCGRPRVLSLGHPSTVDGVSRLLEDLASDCEGVARELSTRLARVDAYLRLNVDRGMEGVSIDNWNDLGDIVTHTDAYVETPAISEALDASLTRLQERIGTITLGKINDSSNQPINETPSMAPNLGLVITEANDMLEPLEFMCTALKKVLETAKNNAPVNEEQNQLLKMLKLHLATIKNHRTKLEEDRKIDNAAIPLEPTVIEPLKDYADELNKLHQLLSNNKRNEFSLVNRNTDEGNEGIIARKTREVDGAMQRYTTALHHFAARTVGGMQQELSQFHAEGPHETGKIHPDRSVDSNAYGVQHVTCLEGTRRKTLDTLRSWVDDESTEKWIFFFLDVAGSGKSTIAKHMAEEWKRKTRLLARFFFSRDTLETMSTKLFCSTVANAFATVDSNFKAHMDKFKKRPDLELISFEELFEGLVAGPLMAANRRAILIIDALDECKPRNRDQLLNVLLNQHSSIPLLRIVATGRPERNIKHWAIEIFRIGYVDFNRLEGNSQDVELYIRRRLRHLPDIQDRLYPVIRHAEGLFIWARIACDLLDDSADINGLLEKLGREVRLDYLYKIALEQSLPKDEASQRAVVMVLRMIIAAKEPLSIAELEKLSPSDGLVRRVVTRLGSLLLYQDHQDPIRLLHATFREFLTTRVKAGIYFVQPELGHYVLASGCINILEHQENSNFDRVDSISERKANSILQDTY